MPRKYKKEKRIQFSKVFKKAPLLWFLVGMFIVLQVYFAIQTATLGATMVKLEQEEKLFSEANLRSKSELARLTSLAEVGKNSEELGFFEPQSTIYIDVEEFVAKLP